MTEQEKIDALQRRTEETDVERLTSALANAAERIINKMYPFRDPNAEEEEILVPTYYDRLQIDLAAYLLQDREDGVVSHTEQGVTDVFESSYVPESMLSKVVSFCKVV